MKYGLLEMANWRGLSLPAASFEVPAHDRFQSLDRFADIKLTAATIGNILTIASRLWNTETERP